MALSEELTGGFEPPIGVVGDVQVFFDEDVTLTRLSGEIDLALGPELEDAGRDAIDRGEPVRVDVSQVSFIDSVAIGFLARLAAAGHGIGCPPVVAGASLRVRQALRMSGLAELVEVQAQS